MAESKISAPLWFVRAVARPVEDRFLEVAGCRIHYLRWGTPGRPGLIFVHGGYAHAHWWDFIAPFFAEESCVAALDLSGMGDSGHRDHYTAEIFATEVIAVCAHAGLGDRPVVVGHSFGGFVALKTALLYSSQIAGVVLVDFPVRPPQLESAPKRGRSRPKEIYPDLPAARARFKLIPPQPCDNEFILDYIAQRSLQKVTGGWTWKFDEKLFDELQRGDLSGDLMKLARRTAVIYGEKSALFSPEIVAHMKKLVERRAPVIAMPEAHHHLFLDQPLAFVALLRTLLAEWSVQRPTSNSQL